MLKLQKSILESVARGDPLTETADRLCLEVEALVPGAICSILTVDRGGFVHPLSAPSLPAAYSAALDGVMIGPNVGSCGSAAYLREPVTVTDIENDVRWARYKDGPLALGLMACWSFPVFADDGEVVATFAFYYREPRGPSVFEQELVKTCVDLCAIALARHFRVEERERRASVDALTGLSNRAAFDAALTQLSAMTEAAWALLVIDVDNLKVVNDTFGHQTGDELLQAVAERIAEAAAPDRAFRLGGDEFAVVVQAPDAIADLDAAADRILQAVSRAAVCCGHTIGPRATIGGAMVCPGGQAAEVVRQNADVALYHAKEVGRGRFVPYSAGLGTTITRRLTAIRALEAAFEDDRLEAFYQPIVRSDEGNLVGLEALCRLRGVDGEVVSAAAFISATSDAHVARELTRRMLAIVSADVGGWLRSGLPVQRVAVNISSADIHAGTLCEEATDAFERWGIPLRCLTFEVAETVYMGHRDHAVSRELQRIRARGFQVALDDFGTGFASLTHLMTTPVDIIKIDKSFVDRLSPTDASAAILEGVIGIAGKLGIDVVAEGVETEEQAAQLRSLGCNLCQGYLFARPMCADDIARYLSRRLLEMAAAA